MESSGDVLIEILVIEVRKPLIQNMYVTYACMDVCMYVCVYVCVCISMCI